MAMKAEDYFFEALLVQLNKQIIKSSTFLEEETFREKIKLATSPNVPDDIVNSVIGSLVRGDFITSIEDEIGGRFVRLNYANVNAAVVSEVAERSGFIYRYHQIGAPLLKKISEHFYPEQLGENQVSAEDAPLEDIPASDRIVRRSDNVEKISEAQDDITEIKKSLREDNGVGSELGDEREIIELELDIASEVLQKPRFRLRSLISWIVPALRYLANKFADSSIATIARRLIELLLGLL